MARRRNASKRQVLPDAKYKCAVVARLINCLMIDGKKSIAENILYKALDELKKVTNREPLEAFYEALANIRPEVEVKSRRIGGATYQVPVEVPYNRSLALAMRWLITHSKKRPEKTMEKSLAGELIDAINLRGASVKKRDDTHKMAESNRAFAHYNKIA